MTRRLNISIFSLILTFNLFAQDENCWPIFRGGQDLRGISEMDLPDSPELLWSFTAEDQIKASPVICRNILVAGSVDGCLYALDYQGNEIWSRQTDNAIEAPVLIVGETIFAGNLDGTFFALDLQNGHEKWRFQADNQISGSANWWEKGRELHL